MPELFGEDPMIVAKKADVGRLIHRRDEGPLTGVITTVAQRRVFVRLGSKPYSVAVSPVELEFIEPEVRP